MSQRPWLVVLGLAVLVHGAALLVTAGRLGGIDACAFRSTDSVEYWDLARSLAADGTYSRLGRPDLWRVPLYPAFLAGVIGIFGESPQAAVLCQHALSVLNLMLFYAAGSVVLGGRRAAVAAALWAIDPFRVYYSGWLLAETLFITWLLAAGILWLQSRTPERPEAGVSLLEPIPKPFGTDGFSPQVAHPHRFWDGLLAAFALSRRLAAVFLGLALGAAMLTRPIGVFLPVVATAGLLLRRGAPWQRRCGYAAVCALATAATVAPWLIRNRAVSGRWALSYQSGVSLAYFKAVEVLLWDRGLASSRFDPSVVNPILEEIDVRLADRWQRDHGPPASEQAAELTWPNIIYGKLCRVPPVEVSRELWRIGMGLLAERPGATAACYSARSLSMLTFPASIGLWPPANARAAPLATVLGTGRPGLARAVAVALGGAFAVLTAAAVFRVVPVLWRRERFTAWFVVVTLLGFLAMTAPFEDPRFREPLVPMLLLIALLPCATGVHGRCCT